MRSPMAILKIKHKKTNEAHRVSFIFSVISLWHWAYWHFNYLFNIIFYDNQNKTLPLGQDLSTKILVDTSKLELKLKGKKEFHIVNFEEKDNDFSNINIKTIEVCEYLW